MKMTEESQKSQERNEKKICNQWRNAVWNNGENGSNMNENQWRKTANNMNNENIENNEKNQ